MCLFYYDLVLALPGYGSKLPSWYAISVGYTICVLNMTLCCCYILMLLYISRRVYTFPRTYYYTMYSLTRSKVNSVSNILILKGLIVIAYSMYTVHVRDPIIVYTLLVVSPAV